jgi:F1F0 ATPase subunit 2
MPEALAALTAVAAGAGLGAIFFGGLWWTVRRAASSARPAQCIVVSALLRMSMALGGFYLVAGGHWERLLLCLVGFIAARAVVTWLTRLPAPERPTPLPQARHAP